MSFTTRVTYNEVELDVWFDHTPAEGDGFHDQRYEAETIAERIEVGGVDILPMLTDEQIAKIERLIHA